MFASCSKQADEVLYRCGRTIGHVTGGDFAVMGVPLFLFAFLVSS